LIGRFFRKSCLLIPLFILVLGLSACSEEVNARGKVLYSNTLHTPYPLYTNTFVETGIETPVVIHTLCPTQKSLLATSTKSASKPPHTDTPTSLSCWVNGGNIQVGSLQTDLLKEPLDFRIYLPPCYDQQLNRRYPVLYLFHGQGFLADQWDRIGVDETADELIAEREIPPLIVVMPHEIGSEPPTGSKFAQAIVEDFIPYVDATYRTLPDRSNRAVGGLSRGGGWAVHFGISEWELFGALGAHSPGIFRADDLYIRKWLDNIPKASYPRIYIDIGDRDLPEILDSATWLEQLLNKKDIPHEWHFFSGYHNEEYWRAHLDSYLHWYTQDW
jgi:enterochelin esterase-like enzyme